MQIDRLVAEHKFLLTKLSITELLDRIRKFRRLNILNLNDEELSHEIQKVLFVDQKYIARVYSREFSAGDVFFRARKAENLTIPVACASKENDAWAAPPQVVVKYSRLNRVGESILYTSFANPNVSLKEIRMDVGGFAVVFAYRAKRKIVAVSMGEKFIGLVRFWT